MKEEPKVPPRPQVFCLGAAGFEPAIRCFMYHAELSKLRDSFLLVLFHLSILATITIPVGQNQPCACKRAKGDNHRFRAQEFCRFRTCNLVFLAPYQLPKIIVSQVVSANVLVVDFTLRLDGHDYYPPESTTGGNTCKKKRKIAIIYQVSGLGRLIFITLLNSACFEPRSLRF